MCVCVCVHVGGGTQTSFVLMIVNVSRSSENSKVFQEIRFSLALSHVQWRDGTCHVHEQKSYLASPAVNEPLTAYMHTIGSSHYTYTSPKSFACYTRHSDELLILKMNSVAGKGLFSCYSFSDGIYMHQGIRLYLFVWIHPVGHNTLMNKWH